MAGPELFAGGDFVGLLAVGRRGEEGFEAFFLCMLLDSVSEEEDRGFVVLILPGLQEPVGCDQCRDVILINGPRSGTAAGGNDRSAEREEDQQQQRKQDLLEWVRMMPHVPFLTARRG